MPALSMFYGIIVRMQSERGAKHKVPHLHAIYSEDEVVVSLDGNVLEGSLPKKQMQILLAWIAIHEDELVANWDMLQNGEGYFKISPLR